MSHLATERPPDVQPGYHACSVHRSRKEHRDALLAFAVQGLERGEKVVCASAGAPDRSVLGYLREDGVDSAPFLESGQLSVITMEAAYMPNGTFDCSEALDRIEKLIVGGRKEGYPGVRLPGDACWLADHPESWESFLEYEGAVNGVLQEHGGSALCQYDRHRFDSDALLQAIAVHPVALVSGDTFPNPNPVDPRDTRGLDPLWLHLKRAHGTHRSHDADWATPGVSPRAPLISILILESQELVREGLVQLLGAEGGFSIGVDVGTPDEALREIRRDAPDLVLMDIDMAGEGGIAFVEALSSENPDVGILVLSRHDELLYARRVLQAGARGFLGKNVNVSELSAAARTVAGGGSYVSEQIRDHLVEQIAGGHGGRDGHPLAALTNRELQVFRLLGQGHGTREIAEMLEISGKTVVTHRLNIMKKLTLDNAAQLVHRAIASTRFGVHIPKEG